MAKVLFICLYIWWAFWTAPLYATVRGVVPNGQVYASALIWPITLPPLLYGLARGEAS